jgi:cyclic beta-1,2-glucan synthetase
VTHRRAAGRRRDREQALHLVDKYQDRHLADRVFELAWTHSQVVLRQLNASEADAQLYARLAGSRDLSAAPACAPTRPSSRATAAASPACGRMRSRATCRSCCCRSATPPIIELARQLVQAHAYWRLKGLTVDLVIWCDDPSGYRQALHDQIMGMIASGMDAQSLDRPGGVFVRLLEQIPNEDRILMQSVARVVLSDENAASWPTSCAAPPCRRRCRRRC